MASYDYEKNKPAANAKSADETLVTEVMIVNKEKIARHDEQHHKDMELAASLQASWGKRVDAEHNYKH